MKYLSMNNLQQYCEAQSDPTCVRLILNQLLQVLQYLHNSDIMHQDIKLKNILIAIKEPLIKLVNFDLFSLQRLSESFCETLNYVAPEVYKERNKQHKPYFNQVDIWALSVVVY